MTHRVNTRRERFYKKVLLDSSNISQDGEDWKSVGVKLEFPTNLTTVVISNDNNDRCTQYSFDGRNLDGDLFCDDGPFSQDCTSEGYFYLMLPEGTTLETNEKVQVRVWAWSGGTGR